MGKYSTYNQQKMDTTIVSQAQSQDQARQYAIDWQNWQSEENLSYGELAEWQEVFTELARKYGLEEEFKENGII